VLRCSRSVARINSGRIAWDRGVQAQYILVRREKSTVSPENLRTTAPSIQQGWLFAQGVVATPVSKAVSII